MGCWMWDCHFLGYCTHMYRAFDFMIPSASCNLLLLAAQTLRVCFSSELICLTRRCYEIRQPQYPIYVRGAQL